jgi:hypothetical protein
VVAMNNNRRSKAMKKNFVVGRKEQEYISKEFNLHHKQEKLDEMNELKKRW